MCPLNTNKTIGYISIYLIIYSIYYVIGMWGFLVLKRLSVVFDFIRHFNKLKSKYFS